MSAPNAFASLEVWFLTGSQHLYGPETLAQVAWQSAQIAGALEAAPAVPVRIVWKPVLTQPDEIRRVMLAANDSDAVIGVIAWMHTFSPAKMWIAGLSALDKPLLHLHTQANVALPWADIDFDFMNLNQAAHGDREFGYIQTRLALRRKTVVGHVSDPRVVGINLVMPEDGYVSMSDYTLQMRMVGYLHGVYPKVHITLHAGELAPGLVTYDGLSFHVRQAVEIAHAERIGHGVDIMCEERPSDLLKEMAAKHVMVEINLSSNDLILGISGKNHPFPIYRKFGVPVALSTDDEGVSRIDITHEYVRAVETYALAYADLKQMVRTSLEHDFLPGPSLWREQDVFTRPVAACSTEFLGAEKPSAACATFLKSSEKAQQQWELERRFRAFESTN